MNSLTFKTFRLRAWLVGTICLAVLMLSPRPLPAQSDACGLLKAADVAPLLGGTPASKSMPEGLTCSWTGSIAGHKLLILTYKNRGIPGEAAFNGARMGAQSEKDAKVSDEAGLGDKAFSSQVSFGVVFIVLKQGRLLQLQYWTGAQGTSQDVAAMRPIVKKAVAAF